MIMRIIVVILLSCTLLACTHTKDASKGADESTFGEQLIKHEASFRPSDYDPDPAQKSSKNTEQSTEQQQSATEYQAAVSLDLVPGFRVQVFSLTNIDEARAKKAEIEALVPEEWVYLEYESPAYKIRVGNFVNRFEADRFTKQMIERGYSEAWTVPARVFRNAPPPSR